MKMSAMGCALVATAVMLAAVPAQAAAMSEPEARRLLQQASFGPTNDTVAEAMALGRAAWLQRQFALPASGYVAPYVGHDRSVACPKPPEPPAGAASAVLDAHHAAERAARICGRDNFSMFPVQRQFFDNAMNRPDQLRQRTALALSQILVVSANTVKLPYAMANYQRIFLTHAFGNFRDILREVTLSPAMGRYLNMANNDKPNPIKGTAPNENYAREVLQLFSIGEIRLNRDGTPVLDAAGQPLPAYDQETVEGFAYAFTGWTYAPRPGATRNRFGNPAYYGAPMIAFADHHATGAKKLLNGLVVPAGGTAQSDLDAAIGSLFNHPNVGPFIGRQLIQQLVTANPSPAYVARVAAAFGGGAGAPRGDMKATLEAILTDPEARNPQDASSFGKLREAIVQLTHLLRALNGRSDGVWLRSQASALGQPVFDPPSVFSFFPPDYDLPDDPALDGPAFGIFNARTVFKLSSVFSTLLSGRAIAPDTNVAGATGTAIDLARWQSLAATPAAMVAEIDRVLLAGRMSEGLKTAALRAAQIAPATRPLDRAKAALFLVAMSPEYLVEN